MSILKDDALNLPKGYKQTEVGVIPEDWGVKTIGQILKIKHGKDQKQVVSTNGNYPIYGSGGLIAWADRYLYDKPSVLIGRKGTIDKPRYIKVPFWTVDTMFYSEIFLDSDPFFIYCKFQVINWYQYNEASGVPSLNAKTVEFIEIPIPPLPEQTAIAHALSDMDALIAQTEKLIEKKKAIKQGMMQELLKPKEGWVTKKLGEVGEIITGSTPSTIIAEYWNGNIPWITPTDISESRDIEVSERQITKKGLGQLRKLPENSLLITCIASIGKNAILRKPGACNQQINAIIPNQNYHVEFLYYLLETNRSLLIGSAGITATLILSKKEFSEISFCFPDVKQQIQIAEIISCLDNQISTIKYKLKKLKNQKQGMMQALLTGKIRLI